VRVGDAAGLADPLGADPELRLRSLVCAPLLGRSGARGVLVAARALENPSPFTSDELRLLRRLAGTAAVAVENARLFEAAQAASRAKSDFIATMSHELRTPVNAVLGHLELLEIGIHGEVNAAQRGAIGRVQAATQHLRGLIEEVLSFAQVEAGRAEVRIQETDLCAIAREVASVVEPLAARKGLACAVECGETGVVVDTDPDKVRQILINLAGNAVKFTDQGGIRIAVRRRDEGAVASVTDTGIDISPEDQERLFRPFEQLRTGLSRPHGGTGLGLYLSRRYAGMLGGTLEVQSESGRGSVFSLVLRNREQGTGNREQ
jgi:signal transduction histidine kinase